MTPELIEMIGTWIVLPICAVAAFLGFLWAMNK